MKEQFRAIYNLFRRYALYGTLSTPMREPLFRQDTYSQLTPYFQNICNFALFPMTEKERTKKPLKALEKLDRVCSDIQKGIIKKRGWNVFSSMLGKSQNIAYPKMEAKAKASFLTDDTCVGCGLCVNNCPMNNLELVNGKVKQKGNCTLCYRCVNICPKQSCTVYFRKKPKKQYQGI